MPTKTIEQGFKEFLQTLTPTEAESEAAKDHRASIEACLKRNFNLTRFFRTGSFGNGTSVSRYSDVDYFADIPRSELKNNSTNTLRDVRNALGLRFPKTEVRVSCPAVFVPFGTDAKESTEVTPADYIEDKNGYRVYDIPNCSDGWMRSSPGAHNAYVREVDRKLNRRVKPLIRFIKAWKYYRKVQISSFYLELRVAKIAADKSSINYDIDVMRVFSHLHSMELAQMQDPIGVSGNIRSCSTNAQLDDAKSKLRTALILAKNACNAKSNDDIIEAFKCWNKLYNGRFPRYYY